MNVTPMGGGADKVRSNKTDRLLDRQASEGESHIKMGEESEDFL